MFLMRQYIISLLFISLFSLTNCQKEKRVEQKIDVIDFGDECTSSLLSDIECRFIPLETNDSILVGGINRVEFVDKRIFVLDRSRTNTLSVFDCDGQYITRVGRTGQGPGEYRYLGNFFVDEKKRLLILTDFGKSYLLYYDLDTYQYISSDKFDFFSDCAPLDENRWVWYSPDGFATPQRENYYLRISDQANETAALLNPASFVSIHSINSNDHIHRFKGNVFVHFPFKNTVWRVKQETSEACYDIILGKKQMPPIDYMHSIGSGRRNYTGELFNSEYVYAYRLLELDDYLQITYMYKKGTYFGFYQKKDQRGITYKFPEFIRATGLTGLGNIVGTYKDYFVGYINPIILKRNYTPHEELRKLSENCEAEDNPILFLFKLKK